MLPRVTCGSAYKIIRDCKNDNNILTTNIRKDGTHTTPTEIPENEYLGINSILSRWRIIHAPKAIWLMRLETYNEQLNWCRDQGYRNKLDFWTRQEKRI